MRHMKLDQVRSRLATARIQRQLTLSGTSKLAAGRLSVAQLSRMERVGSGSPAAWKTIAEVLGVELVAILPIAERPDENPQLLLFEGAR